MGCAVLALFISLVTRYIILPFWVFFRLFCIDEKQGKVPEFPFSSFWFFLVLFSFVFGSF